jgi:DNA primase
VGLCPLHRENHPSFYVNACKNLFYCHGCGRGGDLIRFVELFLNLPFRQSIAHLRQELAPASGPQLLEQAATFYQLQLQRYSEGTQYLEQRGLHDPATIEELGIGCAPGGNLRRHLAALGYSFDLLLDIGLINNQGRDAFCRRVILAVSTARSSTCRLTPEVPNQTLKSKLHPATGEIALPKIGTVPKALHPQPDPDASRTSRPPPFSKALRVGRRAGVPARILG